MEQTITHSILVADDNPNNRDLVMDVLRRVKGYDLTFFVAVDGLQAIELAAKEKPDLIVLDIQMPDLSGLQVCEKIRATPEISDTYIIVTSANATPWDKEQARTAGANEYIVKPYDIMELRQSVIKALDSLAATNPTKPSATPAASPGPDTAAPAPNPPE